MLKKKLIAQFRVEPGAQVDLKDYPTDWTDTEEAKELGKETVKERALEILEENRKELAEAQELLYASDIYSVLLVFQAMDAAGKDGTIRHVMSGVNPQGCQVFSFKKPSDEVSITIFSGAIRNACRSAAASAFSIVLTTRKCWW